jgi:hypothetical protein
MRLYTAVIGGQRVLTLNSHDVHEAREALATLLGDVAALSIRHATADEAMAWNAAAMDARLDASSRTEPCPLLPPSMRDAGQLRAADRRQGN